MKHLIIVGLLLYSSLTYAQERILVADETYYVTTRSGATFRLTTSNESIRIHIAQDLAGKYSKVQSQTKEDRKGQYWEHSFTFKNVYYNDMVRFINRLNNKSTKR